MTPEMMGRLLHATADGAGWRTHYTASPGSPSDADCVALVELGLMESRQSSVTDLHVYLATPRGVAVALAESVRRHAKAGELAWDVWWDGDEFDVTVIYAKSRSAARWQMIMRAEVDRQDVAAALRKIHVRRHTP